MKRTIALGTVFLFGLSACDTRQEGNTTVLSVDEGQVQETTETIGNAAETAADQAGEAIQNAGPIIENTAETIGERAGRVGDRIENTAERVDVDVEVRNEGGTNR